jgi:hypothetical protein
MEFKVTGRDLIVGVLAIALVGYVAYKEFWPSREKQIDKAPIASVQGPMNAANIKTALDGSGFKISMGTAKQYERDIKDREAAGPADFEKKIKPTEDPDKEVKKELKDRKDLPVPDAIVKKDEGKVIKYYGINEEDKHAIGVYTDLSKNGSWGVYYRDDRATLAVGQKYLDKSLDVRVMYDVIRWK